MVRIVLYAFEGEHKVAKLICLSVLTSIKVVSKPKQPTMTTSDTEKKPEESGTGAMVPTETSVHGKMFIAPPPPPKPDGPRNPDSWKAIVPGE